MSIDVLADTKRRLQRARRQVDLYDKRNDLSELAKGLRVTTSAKFPPMRMLLR